jgi:hypothetical protein
VNNITEELTKLAKLHADAALSDEEFKSLKARLLSQGFGTQSDVTRVDAQAPVTQEATNKTISDWASWCLALVPIISIPINAIVIGATDNTIVSFLVPVALWLLFFFIDRNIIKEAGGDPPDAINAIGIIFIAVVAVPLYLHERSKKLGKSFSTFYASIVVMALGVLLVVIALVQ